MKIIRHLTKPAITCLLILFCSQLYSADPGSIPGDIQYERMEGDESEMVSFPPAIFPHWVHRINYRCDACHDSLFEMKLGATPVSKALMKEGKVCGACHDGQLAFSAGFENCNRCHVAVKE